MEDAPRAFPDAPRSRSLAFTCSFFCLIFFRVARRCFRSLPTIESLEQPIRTRDGDPTFSVYRFIFFGQICQPDRFGVREVF